MLSLPEPVKWVVWRTTLHSKSTLRKSEQLWSLHWCASGRKGDGWERWSCTPCCCGCHWGWLREDNSARGHFQRREGSQERWSSDSVQPPLPGWQSKGCSLDHREHVCAVGKGGSKLKRLDHRASKAGGSALMLVCDLKKKWGGKMVEVEENKSQELQSTL